MPAYARAHTRATPQHSDLSQDAPSRAGSPRAGNAGNAVAQDRLSRQQGASASPRQGASGFSSPSAGPAGSSARLSSGYRPSASDVLRSVGEGGSGVEGGLGIGGGEGSQVGASGGSLGVAGGAVGVQGANAGTPAASVAAVTSVAPDELCTACEGLSGAEAEALLARPGASVRSVAFGARLPEVGAWIALAEAAGAHLSAAAGADAKAGGREIAAALTGLSDPEQMSAAEQDRLIALARADKTLGAARAALEALFGARRAEALELLKERAEDVSGASAATTLYSRLRGAGMTPQEVDAAVSAYNLSVTIDLPPEPGAPPQTYTIQVQTPYHISTRKRTPASPAASASPTATQVARQAWVAPEERDSALAAAANQTAWAKGSASETQMTLQAALDNDVDGCRALAERVWAAEIAAGEEEAAALEAVSAAISGWMGAHDVGVDCSGFTFTSTQAADPEARAAWSARNPGVSPAVLATNHSNVAAQISPTNAVPVPVYAALSGDLAATSSASHIGLVRDRVDRTASDALALLPEDRRDAARDAARRADGSLQDGDTVYCVQIAHSIDKDGKERPDDLPGPHVGTYVYNRQGVTLWRDDVANGSFVRFYRQRVG